MNPHYVLPISPSSLARSLYANRSLVWRLAKREVVGRYKGSVIGLGWSFFHPILMLGVYTFVFSVVFKARWGGGQTTNKTEFAIILFSGLIIYNFFSEVINRSPGILLDNPNYVKKIIFPLEILSVIVIGSSILHFLISLGILLSAFFFLNGFLHWTLLFIPIVMLPLICMILGFSWMLASLGLYLRDFGHLVRIVTTIMMFLTPIFYPLSALPQGYQAIVLLNPLTFIVEQARKVIVWGELPNLTGILLYSLVSFIIMCLGYAWFQKTRKGFADVV